MAARSVGATGKAFTEVGRRLNLLGVLVALAAVPAVAAEPVTVLLTADTEGHVSPCSSCPAGVGLGGMARRGTTVAELRAAAPGAVLVDAGNALAGPDSVASRGKVIAAAYDALGYRVVNLTHRDLRFGRDATLAVVREAAFAAVSANLLDPSTNEPLVKPYAVVEAGGRRVAFLGLTEPPPAGLEAVPNLREQVAGVTVAPMADAVARWLPKAKAEADAVVLLYHGSPDALSAVRKQVGADVAAVLVGGMRPALLPAEGAPAVAGAAEHGKGVTRVTIDGSGAAAKVAVQLVSVAPTVVPDPKVEAVLAPFAPQDLIAAAVTANVARPAAVTTLPAALDPERIYPLGSEAANRGVRLTVVNASLATEYGGATATEGGRLLVVGTQWENIIPWTIIEERKVPTEYQVPKLSDHLYLVVNGSRVARVIPGDAAPPGHVPLKDLRLARIGDRITGNVAFQLPPDVADAAGPLELRYYDFAHGHIAVPLRAAEAPAPATRPAAAAKPLGSPVKNEVLQAAVYGAQRADNAPGHPAPPPGMQYVAVDFRATSQFTLEADATAFDPKAKPGAKMKIGTVADWTDAMRYATLLADGEYGYAAIPALSTLGESPRFLPDVPTGGTITFLAPAEAKSLAFRVDTPNAKTADGTVINPRGFYVPVEGKQPSLQAPGAMFRIRDDVFSVSVQTQRLAGEFAGVKVPAGQRFLVLGMNVANTGRVGEFFQPKDQVKLVGADAEQVEAHPATYRGPRYPAELLFIPPDENRSFEMAFPLSSQENQPRLAYNGVSMAQVYDLKKVDIDVVAATPPADQPATPNATNNAPAAPDAAPPTEVATATPAVPATPVAPPPADIRKLTAATETIKVDGKEFPARVKAKQSTKPGGIAGVGLTPDMVNGAIDRGAAALWKRVLDRLEKNGAAYGEKDIDGLLSLALVHAHYHKKNPAFDAAVRGFMAKWDPRKSGSTYENGVF
ncbi:MAG TPA: hypothetical protein VK324_09760, partial [Tepidisphaeraceae bacterium]|nr:hypothetical protein [Tepidisphaeraceae bacterium]